MPTYSEVIRFESEKSSSTIIRLVKSGEFFRAYDHSAWLFHTFVAKHKVMRKYYKELARDIFYLGFPVRSFPDNIGGRRFKSTDLGFDIELNEDETPDDSGFDIWKATIEMEHSSKGDFNSLPLAGADAEREAVKRLREYPFERKSLLENTIFIAELRELLGNK